jgi:hypothetical protein
MKPDRVSMIHSNPSFFNENRLGEWPAFRQQFMIPTKDIETMFG